MAHLWWMLAFLVEHYAEYLVGWRPWVAIGNWWYWIVFKMAVVSVARLLCYSYSRWCMGLLSYSRNQAGEISLRNNAIDGTRFSAWFHRSISHYLEC